MESKVPLSRLSPDMREVVLVMQGVARKLIPYLAICAGYFLGSHLGFLFTAEPQALSMLWPPNAILMAALLLTPRKNWIYAVLSVFPAHMLIQLMNHVAVSMALCWFFTNIAEALLGAAAIRYWVKEEINFEKLRHVTSFLAFGVLLAPFVTSFIDVSGIKLFLEGQEDFLVLWRDRFFSNAVSALVFVPVIVTTVEYHFSHVALIGNKRRLEAGILVALLATICLIGFVEGGLDLIFHDIILFALFPVMVWSVLRFGSTFLSYIVLVVSLFAIWGAQHWVGPFNRASAAENILGLHFFMLFTFSPLILLGAVLAEWRSAEASSNNQKKQLDMALRVCEPNMWIWDIENFCPCVKRSDIDMKTLDMPYFFERVHPDDKILARKKFEEAFCSVDLLELEVRLFDRENKIYRWFSCRGSWQLDDEGKPCRMLGFNTDIEKKKIENDRLRRQKDELSHSNRVAMLGEMSGAIAHELNQPLTAILSNAQAAIRIYKNPDAKPIIEEILGDIVSEGKRAGEINQRMRDLLKKGCANIQPCDINTIFNKALALENSELIAKNICARTFVQPALPLVHVDPVQVLQVLLNLINNASDAIVESSHGDRLIQMSAVLDREDFLLILISDSGKGIDEDALETIFEPFFTSKKHGLGLGLAICRSIVEAHGGKLWAYNNAEAGATFCLTLPLVTVD